MSHSAVLRKVGGSVMLAIPPALLDVSSLSAGRRVEVSLEAGRLVIEPEKKPKYTLADLLAQCNGSAPAGREDRTWTSSAPAGKELI